MPTEQQEEKWSRVMSARENLLQLNLGELWHYRDLIMLFVRRDFIAVYKQTVLGPLWHFIQPLFTTAVFVLFGGLANISTDGLPRVLFVLSGIVIWNYFSSCVTKTSNTFIGNSHIFGKVYFPRLAIPISVIISNLMSFFIQLLLLVPFLIYYRHSIQPNAYLLTLPLIILVIAMMGLGFGVIVSSLTIKYRDLNYFISFGIQLAMYATPVIYPLSFIPERFRGFLTLNPLSPVLEMFRYALLGQGTFTSGTLTYSIVVSVVIMLAGVFLFNKVEKNFMDTV